MEVNQPEEHYGLFVFIYPSPFHAPYLFPPCIRSLATCSPFVSSLAAFLLNSLSSLPFFLSYSVISFAVHAFRTITLFFFFVFPCSFYFHSLLLPLSSCIYCNSEMWRNTTNTDVTKYDEYRGNAPTYPAFCVVSDCVTFGQCPVTEHVLPRHAVNECWVCSTNFETVPGRLFRAAVVW